MKPLDLSEKGRSKDGEVISMDRRLFMQLLAFGDCLDPQPVIDALAEAQIEAVVYLDINDPRGIGLLTFSESADFFVTTLREVLTKASFTSLTPKPEYTMLGRSYSIGYENDLLDTLIERPRRRALDPKLPWVVWYPLQRGKHFELLPDQDKSKILMEHGGIGMQFGKGGYGHDIRLACHGLDKNDNDFVIAVLSGDLFPLSAIIQTMRKTQQTAKHLATLGPFFVGKAIWQGDFRS